MVQWRRQKLRSLSYRKLRQLNNYFSGVMKCFWSCFQRWWKNNHNCNINLGCLDILFGITNENKDTMIHSLNYCILFAKNYIVKCKSQHNPCNFNNFFPKLKYRIDVERQIAECNGQVLEFKTKWSFIYQYYWLSLKYQIYIFFSVLYYALSMFICTLL